MMADSPQNFLSFDTETIFGYGRLITLGDGSHYFIDDFEDLISIIEKYAGTSFFCWNMKFDFQGLLKYLPLGVKERIWSDQSHRAMYNDFVIKYIADKEAIIRHGNNALKFYDLAQFYKDPYFISLDTAARKYLGKEKIKNDPEKRFKDLQRLKEGQTLDDIRGSQGELEKILKSTEFLKYAKEDAALTQQLLDLFLGVARQFGASPDKYYSPASLGVAMTKAHLCEDEYPAWCDQGEMEKIIAPTCRGGVFETLMRGDFGKCTMFDMKSAHPANANRLPHWYDGEFMKIQGEDLLQKMMKENPELHYGWGKCRFNSVYIPYQTRDKKIVYPRGERTQSITLVEYLFLKEIGDPVEWIEGAVWTRKTSDHRNPFGWIQEVFDRRKQTAKNTMENYFLKITMNGVTGKTGQRKGRGPLKNLAYYSYIAAETRVALFRKVLQNKLRVIFYATDGVLVEGELPEEKGKELGEWESEVSDRALVVGIGRYELERNGRVETKARGLEGAKEVGLRALIEANRNKKRIPTTKVKVVGLGDICTKQRKFSEEDLNLFKPQTKYMDIRADDKLLWEGIETFGDLLGKVHTGKRFDVRDTDKLSRSGLTRQKKLEDTENLVAKGKADTKVSIVRQKTEATTLKRELVSYLEYGDLSSISISHEAIKMLTAGGDCEGIKQVAVRESQKIGSDVVTKEISKSALKQIHEYQDENEIIVLLNEARKERGSEETEYTKCLQAVTEIKEGETEIQLVGGRVETCITGKQVLVPYYDGGKLTGVYKNRIAQRSSKRTTDNLYTLNQAPFFPRANGYLCELELTYPHTVRGLSVSQKEAHTHVLEWKKLHGKDRGWQTEPIASFDNFHIWSSRNPTKKHPHIHIEWVNCHHLKGSDRYLRSSPLMQGEGLQKLKEEWFDVLRKNRIIHEEDKTDSGKPITPKTLDVYYHFTPLSHKPEINNRIKYVSRSPLVDLDQYFENNKFEPDKINKEELKEIVEFKPARHVSGEWNNITKVLKPVKESYCSLCGDKASQMDVSAKECKRIIESGNTIIVAYEYATRKYLIVKRRKKKEDKMSTVHQIQLPEVITAYGNEAIKK